MTDERFRKLGIFKTLATSLYQRLDQEGQSHVYGFPNGNSIHGFKKHLGWQVLDPVPFLIRPLRSGYALKKLGLKHGSSLLDIPLPVSLGVRLRRHDIRPITKFGPEFDDLWTRVAPQIRVGIIRDSSHLTWRFTNNPSYDYRTLAAYNGNTLLGFVTYRIADKHGGRVGYIMETLEKPGTNVTAALLATAMRNMRSDGAEVVLAWNMNHAFNHAAH